MAILQQIFTFHFDKIFHQKMLTFYFNILWMITTWAKSQNWWKKQHYQMNNTNNDILILLFYGTN